MGLSLEEFDELCKETAAKHAELKRLEGEVKELKKKVLNVLLTKDDEDQTHKAGGATFYVRHVNSATVPKDLTKKKELFDYVRLKYPDWYRDQVTFNHRSLTSLYNAEEEAANLKEEEYEGMPGVSVHVGEGLGIRGAKAK